MFNGKYIKFLEKEIEHLKKENSSLREENFKITAALVAKESPTAYEHFLKEEDQKKEKNPHMKRFLAEQRILNKYAQEIEKPIQAEEILESLKIMRGAPKPAPVHQNSES